MTDPNAATELRILGIGGFPEVRPGADIAAMVGDRLVAAGLAPEAGDVLVVTHKVISKAEGQLVDLDTVEASPFARRYAEAWDKDPRQVEVVLRQSRRISRMERGIIIAETAHGFVCANAGVDASNVAPGVVCLLPEDPDRSAAAIRDRLGERFGVAPGVIVSDSFGRAWRNGIVNVAIGIAGLPALTDYRGESDAAGYALHVSVLATADEVAAAAELVMNKLDAVPAALLRGYRSPGDHAPGTGKDLIMDPARDLFR